MRVKLNDVRIAFCQSVFEAEQYQGKGVARHSATFLVEPGSANDKAIQKAIEAEAQAKWPKKWQAMLESMRGNSNKYCYQKGDLKEYDGFAGMMYIGAHRKQTDGQPLLIDQHKNPLKPSDGKPYGGCYVNCSFDIYAQDGENSGIRAGLMGIQFLRDGDSFGGAGKSKGDEFDDIEAPEDDLA
jgi:hypothetical protein